MIKVRGLVMKLPSERAFQAEGISSAKVLRKEQAQSVKGRGSRTDWLEVTEHRVGDEVIEVLGAGY